MQDNRKAKAELEAAARRATDGQVLEDVERLIGVRNERQAKRTPLLFAPTIGAAIAFAALVLVGTLPGLRTVQAIEPRASDGHQDPVSTLHEPAEAYQRCPT